MSQIIFDKLNVAPSVPANGSVAIYVKADEILYGRSDDGSEFPIGPLPVNTANISSLASIDYIDFDTSTIIPNTAGRLTWNDIDGTLNLGMRGGLVTLQIGQEELILVHNNSGVTFTNAQVIRIVGSIGSRLTAALALANNELTSSTTFALVTESIINNKEGYATTSGLVRDIDTSMFLEGSLLYLSPAVPGGITATKPVAPNHIVQVGWCVRSHPTLGSIYVKVQNGYELDELHDVLIAAKQNNDIIKWDSTQNVWKNVNKVSFITSLPTTTKTLSYDILPTDYTIRVNAVANAVTITLPNATTNIEKIYVVKRVDSSANIVTINTTSSQTIDGSLSVTISTQYKSLMFQSNGTSWDII